MTIKERIEMAGEKADFDGVEIPVVVPTYHIRRIASACARETILVAKERLEKGDNRWTRYLLPNQAEGCRRAIEVLDALCDELAGGNQAAEGHAVTPSASAAQK